MPLSNFITGSLGALAAQLAALLLSRPEVTVHFNVSRPSEEEQFRELVRLGLCGASIPAIQTEARLCLTADPWRGVSPDRIFYFADYRSASDSNRLKLLTSRSEQIVNVVYSPFSGGGSSQWLTGEHRQPIPAKLPHCRVFWTAMVLARTNLANPLSREGLIHIAATLIDFKQEIEERAANYFVRQPLRFWASDESVLDIIRIEDAAKLLDELAVNSPQDDLPEYIGSLSFTKLSDIYRDLAAAYGIESLIVSDRAAMNPVDRLFERRLYGLTEWLQLSERAELNAHHRLAGVLTKNDRMSLLPDLRYRPADMDLQSALLSKTIGDGRRAHHYFMTHGGGKTVVLLNAIGQGIRYWIRLINCLTTYGYRVLLWLPSSLPLEDQIEELAAILESESVDRCSLIAWCTGAKAAIKLLKLHPRIAISLVLLNCTLKCGKGDPQLQSEYERNFEMFCKLVTAHPDMAATVSATLLRSQSESEPAVNHNADPERLGHSILDMTNRCLREEKLAPFRDHTTLLDYCGQIQEFWSYDTAIDVESLDIPVLTIASELDRVVSLDGQQQALRRFPRASFVQLPGSTHYALFDQAATLAELIDIFISRASEIP